MVQPLHLQDNLSKMPLIQKMQETVRAVPELERQQFAEQLSQEAKNKAQRAQDAKETVKGIIREKQKKENREKKKKMNSNIKAEEIRDELKDNEIENENSGNLIDITI